MTARLSSKQREALSAVAAGRVTYGDPHPRMLARRVAAAQQRAAAGEYETTIIGERRPVVTSPRALARHVFQIDGHDIYGAEHATYGSLGERGLIDAYPNDDGTSRTVTLTEAGQAQMAGLR